jgi:hypothetical protein
MEDQENKMPKGSDLLVMALGQREKGIELVHGNGPEPFGSGCLDFRPDLWLPV